jgi:hypothetical protein
MGDPASSYATAGIALRISGTFKPHHHDKMETPLVGDTQNYSCKKLILHGNGLLFPYKAGNSFIS